jgi:hypothetical protein
MSYPKGLKIYLGDSVYAQYDGYVITLTTENGIPEDPTNTIHLEPDVLNKLMAFSKALRIMAKNDL